MIKRIVQMTFRPEAVDDFITLFSRYRNDIRTFPGCKHLELWRNSEPDHVFFTYSWWEREEQLEAYRHSELFRAVWPRTKRLFADKPRAWTVREVSFREGQNPG
jgi:hypothetical protein